MLGQLQAFLSLFEPVLQGGALAGGQISVLLRLLELILGLLELRFQGRALVGCRSAFCCACWSLSWACLSCVSKAARWLGWIRILLRLLELILGLLELRFQGGALAGGQIQVPLRLLEFILRLLKLSLEGGALAGGQIRVLLRLLELVLGLLELSFQGGALGGRRSAFCGAC